MLQDFHILREKTEIGSSRFNLFSALKMAAILCLSFVVSACGPSDPNASVSRQDLRLSQEILADVIETESALSPQTTARLGLTDNRPEFEKQLLDDHSQAGFERKRLTRIELLQRVQTRPRLPQSHPLARKLSIAETSLQNLVRLEQSGHGRYTLSSAHPYAIDPFSGVWRDGPAILAYDHSVNSGADAAAYIQRMEALADSLDDTRRRLAADEAVGHALPKPLVNATVRNIQLLLVGTPNNLDQVPETLANLMSGVPSITTEDRAAFVQRANDIKINKIRPSFDALLRSLEENSNSAPNSSGIWGQPSGYETYLSLLAFHASEDVSPEQLHIANLQANIDALENFSAQLNFEETIEVPQSLNERLDLFFTPETDVLEPEESQSATATIASITRPERQFLVSNHSDWSNYFNPLRTQYTERFTRQTSVYSGLEQFASFDGIMQGLNLYVTTRDAEEDILADYLILIETSLATLDTGLHHARWSFEQSVGYMVEYTGLPETIAQQAALWVSASPGLESAKIIAYRRIQSLSDRARAVLGRAYSESEFQAVIIDGGPRPLSMIETDIEQWYAAKLDQ